MKLKPNMENNK